MKKTLLNILLGLALSGWASAQSTEAVVKTKPDGNLTANFKVPTGKTIQISSGGTLIIKAGATIEAEAGSTVLGLGGGGGLTNFASTLTGGTLTFAGTLGAGRTITWRDLAGTVALTSDLSSYLTTSAATAGYQPLDQMLTDIAALTSPGGDRLGFWDHSAGVFTWLQLGTNLSITDTTLNAAGGGITALTGDVTASGSGSVAAALANTAVTPGNYFPANITVDAKGRITAAQSMLTNAGPGSVAVVVPDYGETGSYFGYQFVYISDPFDTPVETTARLLNAGGTDMREILLPASGGTLALTSDLPTTSLTLAGGTVTSSSPVLTMSQTWNNAAVNFKGMAYNIVDTAYNTSDSRLFEFSTTSQGPRVWALANGHVSAARFAAVGTSSYLDANCVVAGSHIVESGFVALNNAQNVWIKRGTGSPEGAQTASPGSLFLRTDGGAGTTFYVKESGTGNTGWVAK